MIRLDLTKTFRQDNQNATYMYEIVVPMAKDVFWYMDSLIKTHLGMISNNPNHDAYTDLSGGAKMPYTDNQDICGRSFIGQYRFDNNDNDILILSVHAGTNSYRGASIDTFRIDDSSVRNSFKIQVSLFFTRTLVNNGRVRLVDDYMQESEGESGNEQSNVQNSYFDAELIKSCGIRGVAPIKYIQADRYFEATIPLQLIKNVGNALFTFNNSPKALPRIGVTTISSLNKKKIFIYNNPRTNGNYRNLIYTDSINYTGIDNLTPTKICVIGDSNYNFGTPAMLNQKYFENLGDMIPIMPIFLGVDDTEDPRILDFSSTIDGFYQTNLNFKNVGVMEAHYIMNNTSFTNLGNCFLMKD